MNFSERLSIEITLEASAHVLSINLLFVQFFINYYVDSSTIICLFVVYSEFELQSLLPDVVEDNQSGQSLNGKMNSEVRIAIKPIN